MLRDHRFFWRENFCSLAATIVFIRTCTDKPISRFRMSVLITVFEYARILSPTKRFRSNLLSLAISYESFVPVVLRVAGSVFLSGIPSPEFEYKKLYQSAPVQCSFCVETVDASGDLTVLPRYLSALLVARNTSAVTSSLAVSRSTNTLRFRHQHYLHGRNIVSHHFDHDGSCFHFLQRVGGGSRGRKLKMLRVVSECSRAC